MVKTNGALVTTRIREMIRKYAAKPERFFSEDGQVNENELERLIAERVSIRPDLRGGKACIRGTRIAVSDIIGDTCDLDVSKDYILTQQYGRIDPEWIDVAYAFWMKNPGKVAEDCQAGYGKPIPQELYR